ncbi:MAG: glycosyltransferase family 4 protein [Deltaproteobacteria bacterium]|nr:glycosyltransferase family 4 protein [Candidatus Zymogenaceae bacterium]
MAYNFPPMGGGGVQRSAKFVKYLPRFGWIPAVVAADDPSYWARDDTLIDDIAADTVVKRLSPLRPHALYYLLSRITSKAASGRIMDSLFFPDDRILWALRAALAARAMIKKHAIRAVYTTSPPHSTHVSGLLLKRMTGLPWVADFRDSWTGDFRYDPPTRWVRRAHSCCERKILEEADQVICNTESSRENYITGFGIDPKRLVTIYNGFDASDFIPNPGRRHRSSDRIVITHSGSFYGSYFPETFVRALALALKNNADLERRIVVRFVGVMDGEIRENIRGLLPDHCDFWGYVSHAEAIRAIAESDINLIVLPVEEKASYLVPGKLFEYLAAGRPILAIAPQGETARIIESAGAGIVLSEDGAGELADGLSRAIPMLAAGGLVPDKATADRFERRRLTGQLAQVLNDVIGE